MRSADSVGTNKRVESDIDVLNHFNSTHGTAFDSIRSYTAYTDLPWETRCFDIGNVSEDGMGFVTFTKLANREINPPHADHPDFKPGITDRYPLPKPSFTESFAIRELGEGFRYCRKKDWRLFGSTLITTRLLDPTTIRFLDFDATPEYRKMQDQAITASKNEISKIYNTCLMRAFKSGWVYYKLKELCSTKSFQKPFLEQYYFADPDPIASFLYDHFLETCRPDEYEAKNAKRRERLMDEYY